jgi:Cytochrome P460
MLRSSTALKMSRPHFIWRYILDGGTPYETLHILPGCSCNNGQPCRPHCPCTRTREWESAPAFVIEIPHGYRDWRWISSAHEAGNLNSLGAVLGNDVAIKAYRDGNLPFPDGTIIAALHYSYVPSEENNKVFGQAQSFVPGAPTNIQFMVKDSKKYAATGGGFGHFADGKHGDAAFMKGCFPCHEKAKATDLVFTHYVP